MIGKRFSRAFYGYDRKCVDKMVGEKLQEIEAATTGAEVTEGHHQMQIMLSLLRMELEGAKVRKTLLHRSRNFVSDFPDYYKIKAQSMAQDIMKEAQEYVREKEGKVAKVAKRIEEIEQQLTVIYEEIDNVMRAVTLDNLIASSSDSAQVSQGGKLIAFADFLTLPADNDTKKYQSKEILSVIPVIEEAVSTKETVSREYTELQQQAISKAVNEIAATKKAAQIDILIVEDDQSILRILVSILEREGFVVHVAVDGHEAIRLIDTLPYVYIVLLDSMLPYKSGLQILKHIRSKSDWAHTTVIMMTDNMAEKDVIAAIKNGADDSIQKPFNPRELVAKINRSVQRARPLQAQ